MDGTRIKAVNNKHRNFTRGALTKFIRAADEKLADKIAAYVIYCWSLGLAGSNYFYCGVCHSNKDAGGFRHIGTVVSLIGATLLATLREREVLASARRWPQARRCCSRAATDGETVSGKFTWFHSARHQPSARPRGRGIVQGGSVL